MNDQPSLLDDMGEPNDAAAEAFARLEASIIAMDKRLARLTRSIERLAQDKRRTERTDYSDTLGAILAQIAGTRQAMEHNAQSPMWKVTPTMVEQRIDHAVARVNGSDAHAIREARDRLDKAAAALGWRLQQARSRDDQQKWLLRVGIAAALLAAVVTAILPGMIVRELPARWAVPERMARRVLGEESLWDAGSRLMAQGNPGNWETVVSAVRMREHNAEAILACEKTAAAKKRSVKCSIQIR